MTGVDLGEGDFMIYSTSNRKSFIGKKRKKETGIGEGISQFPEVGSPGSHLDHRKVQKNRRNLLDLRRRQKSFLMM